MTTPLVQLRNLHVPSNLEASLHLDYGPLCIVDTDSFTQDTDTSDLTAAIGVATILYKWCPEALYALLDIGSWFSSTWILNLEDDTKLEIGRIRNQLTMGRLDQEGHWSLMTSYTMNPSACEEGPETYAPNVLSGSWLPNPAESMLHDRELESTDEVDRQGRSFVRDLILQECWLTGKNKKHEFFIESEAIGMDPWGDGLKMNPRWLYKALNLASCTTCEKTSQNLNRCARCGTAAYCSAECQRTDWPVHKAVCTMPVEDRGKAIFYAQQGLINYRGEQQMETT